MTRRARKPASEFVAWLLECLAPVGPVACRRVFNFDGLYSGRTMFGLVTEERVYLKLNASDELLREGFKPLRFTARSGEQVVSEGILDEPDTLATWARRAIDIATAGHSAKRRPPR